MIQRAYKRRLAYELSTRNSRMARMLRKKLWIVRLKIRTRDRTWSGNVLRSFCQGYCKGEALNFKFLVKTYRLKIIKAQLMLIGWHRCMRERIHLLERFYQKVERANITQIVMGLMKRDRLAVLREQKLAKERRAAAKLAKIRKDQQIKAMGLNEGRSLVGMFKIKAKHIQDTLELKSNATDHANLVDAAPFLAAEHEALLALEAKAAKEKEERDFELKEQARGRRKPGAAPLTNASGAGGNGGDGGAISLAYQYQPVELREFKGMDRKAARKLWSKLRHNMVDVANIEKLKKLNEDLKKSGGGGGGDGDGDGDGDRDGDRDEEGYTNDDREQQEGKSNSNSDENGQGNHEGDRSSPPPAPGGGGLGFAAIASIGASNDLVLPVAPPPPPPPPPTLSAGEQARKIQADLEAKARVKGGYDSFAPTSESIRYRLMKKLWRKKRAAWTRHTFEWANDSSRRLMHMRDVQALLNGTKTFKDFRSKFAGIAMQEQWPPFLLLHMIPEVEMRTWVEHGVAMEYTATKRAREEHEAKVKEMMEKGLGAGEKKKRMKKKDGEEEEEEEEGE